MTSPCINPSSTIDPDSIVRLWLLRILVTLGGDRHFLGSEGFTHNQLAEFLGLGHWINPSPNAYDQGALQTELRHLHQKAEKERAKLSLPSSLLGNINRLSNLVGLSVADCRILEFVVSIQNESVLDHAASWMEDISLGKIFHALSVILDLPEPEIRDSLSEQGTLSRSGLVSIISARGETPRLRLKLLSDSFANLMLTSESDPSKLLRGCVFAAGPGCSNVLDLSHIESSLKILVPYLSHATATARRGVNILLRGPAGVGKTRLSRALAEELGCELFEVATEDMNGRPFDKTCRLRAFRAAQSLLAQRKALIAFDEVEDICDLISSTREAMAMVQSCDASVARMLENSPVPTFWLSKSTGNLDPDFIRRFDMVFELQMPLKKQRERILRKDCGDFLDADSIQRIAEAESLGPEVIAKTSSVVRTIFDRLGSEGSAAAFENLISNTLKAQGHRPIMKRDPNRLPEVYDPMFIRTNSDLNAVSAGLIKARCGRLCLYGPPGTGKTAYGRWLAQQMDAPLLLKRASELLSRYIGESEQNFANAFRQAAEEDAVLLIDEVDSFLQDRRGAHRSWEITLVNEMLTQMESFPGVFIASTNLMENLDQASLRRFDLKVKFDFLNPEQAWELLRRHCAAIKLSTPQAGLQTRIKRLDRLTPGDFSAVLRQHRFRPVESPEALVSALEAECFMKEGAKMAVGFH